MKLRLALVLVLAATTASILSIACGGMPSAPSVGLPEAGAPSAPSAPSTPGAPASPSSSAAPKK